MAWFSNSCFVLKVFSALAFPAMDFLFLLSRLFLSLFTPVSCCQSCHWWFSPVFPCHWVFVHSLEKKNSFLLSAFWSCRYPRGQNDWTIIGWAENGAPTERSMNLLEFFFFFFHGRLPCMRPGCCHPATPAWCLVKKPAPKFYLGTRLVKGEQRSIQ